MSFNYGAQSDGAQKSNLGGDPASCSQPTFLREISIGALCRSVPSLLHFTSKPAESPASRVGRYTEFKTDFRALGNHKYDYKQTAKRCVFFQVAQKEKHDCARCGTSRSADGRETAAAAAAAATVVAVCDRFADCRFAEFRFAESLLTGLAC